MFTKCSSLILRFRLDWAAASSGFLVPLGGHPRKLLRRSATLRQRTSAGRSGKPLGGCHPVRLEEAAGNRELVSLVTRLTQIYLHLQTAISFGFEVGDHYLGVRLGQEWNFRAVRPEANINPAVESPIAPDFHYRYWFLLLHRSPPFRFCESIRRALTTEACIRRAKLNNAGNIDLTHANAKIALVLNTQRGKKPLA